jgi:hypothetical protein
MMWPIPRDLSRPRESTEQEESSTHAPWGQVLFAIGNLRGQHRNPVVTMPGKEAFYARPIGQILERREVLHDRWRHQPPDERRLGGEFGHSERVRRLTALLRDTGINTGAI